tara:strand:- start:1185 stop:1454 length:270 start_codon:yes stop_codon:yes gene_type:complete
MRVNSSQTTRVTLHTHERFPAFGKRKRNEEKGEQFFLLHFQQFFLSLVFVSALKTRIFVENHHRPSVIKMIKMMKKIITLKRVVDEFIR